MYRFLKKWLLFALFVYMLYAVFWAVAKPSQMSWGDFFVLSNELKYVLYCTSFSLSSIVFCEVFMKVLANNLLENKMVFCINGTILVGNLALAFIFEYVFEFIVPSRSETEYWESVYIFCLISTILAVLHITIRHSQYVVAQNNYNLVLQKNLLRLQINPHFIFNTLSILVGLIDENPKKAEDYLLRITDVYRHMVQHISEDRIRIANAINWSKDYIDIMRLRFGECVFLNINESVRQIDHFFILSNSMLILLENALKHNLFDEKNPLIITIDAGSDDLVVESTNLYEDKTSKTRIPTIGLGLDNLRERYLLECGRKPVIKMIGTNFIVKIPILKNEKDSLNRR